MIKNIDTSVVIVQYTNKDNSFRLSFSELSHQFKINDVDYPFITNYNNNFNQVEEHERFEVGSFNFEIKINNLCHVTGCISDDDKIKVQSEFKKIGKFIFNSLINYPSIRRTIVEKSSDLNNILRFFIGTNDDDKLLRNFEERPAGVKIDKLIMHYTVPNAAKSFKILTTPGTVSAHYLVYENGEIMQLVSENMVAWHAGVSSWKGVSDVNYSSIGIEIVNKGINEETNLCTSFTEAQIKAVEILSKDILQRHKDIIPSNVIGHSDIAPERKIDPGHCFPWKVLAEKGIGLFPNIKLPTYNDIIIQKDSFGSEVLEWKDRISKIGYKVTEGDAFGVLEQKVTQAFNSHYLAKYPVNEWDTHSDIMLSRLLEKIALNNI